MCMKNFTLFLGLFFILSCNNKERTVESTTTDSTSVTQDTMMMVEETTSTNLDEETMGTSLDKNMQQSLSNFELVENKSSDLAVPMLELKDNLCDNLSSLKLKDLTSGAKFELYHINKDNKATLGGFGFEGSYSDNETIIIKDYVRTKNVTCNGKTQKVGIGLRCFIRVTSRNYRGGANLPYLAANVQLNKATASYKIVSLGFGIPGDVFASIKSSGSYDVTGFGEVEKAFDKIMSSLTDKNEMQIDPVPLP